MIDTARELGAPGAPGAGNAPHGRAMGLLIDRLACPPGGACAARIDNVPALRMVRTPAGLRRDSNGGYWGYLGDIAWGIGLAVAGRPAGHHHILNLSLGWNAELGDVGAATRPHVRAVHDALRYARCSGALPIAAAGNTRGQRPPPEGPLVPAAWQRLPAPTAAACQSDFGITPPAPLAGPLVFAVSAVDPFDRALTTTPPGGVAPLAAPGLQVVVSDGNPPPGPPPVGPQTGSSPAAATASALAAIVWTYYPELPPDQVMARVAAAGVELDEPADFCFQKSPCPPVRRLSTCALVQAACQDGRCSPVPACEPDAPRGAPLPGGPHAPLPRTCAETRAPHGCAEDPRDAIGNRRMLPLGDPQPNEDPCGSTCGLGAAESLHATARAAPAEPPAARPATAPLRLELPINPNLSGYAFSAHRLWIRDDATPTRGWLQIDLRARLPADQPGGATLRLELDPGAEGITGQIHAAQIDFTFEERLLDGRPLRRLVGSPITVPPPPAHPPPPGRAERRPRDLLAILHDRGGGRSAPSRPRELLLAGDRVGGPHPGPAAGRCRAGLLPVGLLPVLA